MLMFDFSDINVVTIVITALFNDAMVQGLVSNVNYVDSRRRNFIQKKYGRNRCLQWAHVSFSGL